MAFHAHTTADYPGKQTQYLVSPVEKSDLEAIQMVRFKSFHSTDPFLNLMYPPHKWQPASLRPASGVKPATTPDEVLQDRARRQAAWHATWLDSSVSKGGRWVKMVESAAGELVGMAGWAGSGFWEPAGAAKPVGEEEARPRKELDEIVDWEFMGPFKETVKKVYQGLSPKVEGATYLINLYILPHHQNPDAFSAILASGLAGMRSSITVVTALEAEMYWEHGWKEVAKVEEPGVEKKSLMLLWEAAA